jgi:hypothetical protein
MRKEYMDAPKKMRKPAKRVRQKKYSEAHEDYERGLSDKLFNYNKQPHGVAEALNRASQGYSKKPRVKPSTKRRPQN